MEELLFTPASLLDLLSQIEELSDCYIGLTHTMDDQLQLQIGESVYMINQEEATPVSVEPQVVEQVESINDEAYEALELSGEFDFGDPVDSGVLSQIAKTLLVGGLVRLGGKVIRDGLV